MALSFDVGRLNGPPSVVATVLATAGPAYSKQGTRVLVDADGNLSDMLGGGCLDADIAEHAVAVLNKGEPRVVDYDLRQDDETPWGLGTGCLGALRILIEPLQTDEPVTPLWSCWQAVQSDGWPRRIALEIRSREARNEKTWRPVAVTYHEAHTLSVSAPPKVLAAWDQLNPQQAHCYVQHSPTTAWFLSLIAPAPRLVIVGAGRDVDPLYALARGLRWSVSVYEPRGIECQPGRFPEASYGPGLRPSDLVALERDTHAAVVMTHHLERDTAALAVLADSSIPFIGLLGPATRRDRILGALGAKADLLTGRLFAPVGLALGAHSPAEIALSIGAQVLSHMRAAHGGPLDQQRQYAVEHGP